MPTWAYTANGVDITQYVQPRSVRITSSGFRGLATAYLELVDPLGVLSVSPESEIIITRDGTREYGGITRSRVRKIVGGGSDGRIYRLTCQDFSTLAWDNVAVGPNARRPKLESDRNRILDLVSNYGTKGITTSALVQTIEADMDPFDYRGLTLAECLDQIAGETGGRWYVDQTKRLHYFATEATPAAPFAFTDVNPNGTTTRAYWDLEMPDETAGLVNAVFVRGDGISDWRTNTSSITAYGRREGSIARPKLKTQRQINRAGDAYLKRHAIPLSSGSFQTWEAGGLRAGQILSLTNTPWAMSAVAYRTEEVQLSIDTPTGLALYSVRFGHGRPTLGRATGGQSEGGGTGVGGGSTGEGSDSASRITYTGEAGPNLVPNSSAESVGSEWVAGGFTVGYTHADAKAGGKTFRAAPAGATVSQLRSTDFIPITRTRDYWVSVFSRMSAYTSGLAQLKVLEYNAAGTLLATTVFSSAQAVEADWTRHALRFGDVLTEDGPAFQATTTKIKVAADSAAAATFTWDLDAWQVEASQALTSYLPVPSELVAGSVDIATFAAGIRPVEILASLPALPSASYPQGATVFLTSDNKLYRSTGSAWTAAVPTVDLTGTITTAQIANAAITTAKFAAGIELIDVLGTLPTLPDAAYPQGAVVFLTTDNKLYRSTGSSWTAAVATVDLTGTITAAQITDAAISIAKFAAGIRPVQIVATVPAMPDAAYPQGSIVFVTSDNKLRRSTGSAWTVDVHGGDIVAGSIVAGKIAAGAIGADEIAANAITTSKLAVVGRGAALNGEVNPSDADAWVMHAGVSTSWEVATVTDGKVGPNVIRTNGTAGDAYIYELLKVPIDPAKTYRLHAWVRRKSGDRLVYLLARFTKSDGSLCTASTGTGWTATGSYNYWGLAAATTATLPADSVWREYTMTVGPGGTATFPTAAASVQLGTILALAGTTSGIVELQDFRIEEVIPGQLVVDGAITATKIAAGAVTTAKMTAGTIDGDRITAGTLAATAIVGDSITAGQIAAGAISTSELAALAVTAAKIAAGTITANEIAALTITGAQIAADAITAAKIAANTITSAEIAADTITAGQIAAGAISASELAAGAVTAGKIATGALHVGLFGSDGQQIAPNGAFEMEVSTATYGESISGWNESATAQRKLTAAAGEYRSTAQALVIKKASGGTTTYQRGDYVPYKLNRRLVIKAWVRGKAGNGATGTVAVGAFTATRAGVFVGSAFGSAVTVGTNTTYQEITYTGSISSATVGKIAVTFALGTGFATNDEIFVDDVEVYYADDDISHTAGSVTIDDTGVTIYNGKLAVVNASSVTIIDGTSRMYRIAATGTISRTIGIGVTSFWAEPVTLTSLGNAFSVPSTWIAHRSDSSSASGGAKVGSLWMENAKIIRGANASGSGALHDDLTIGWNYWAEFATYLSAVPGYVIAEIGGRGTGDATHNYYCHYQILSEAVI